MIRRVLIANRGEIALRIIRACKDLGCESVIVTSEADRDSLPARLAAQRVVIGPARASDSYLRPELVVHAALATKCDAIHPGYGFLSEQAPLAELCQDNGLTFIGPTAEILRCLGDKVSARHVAEAAGIPVPRGSTVSDVEDAVARASEIGYSIILKATAGGGGRGIRVLDDDTALRNAFAVAASEAQSAFGDGRLHIERYVRGARHVEVQVLGDRFGNVVDLGERDCSLQFNYQKVVEEAPCPVLSDHHRQAICGAAVGLLKGLGYAGAATVEFLWDPVRSEYFFLEVNPRIQVEHPVTEAITGIDIVAEQIRIASGEQLSLDRTRLNFTGHAIQCRINAQSPRHRLRPSPGRIERWAVPSGPNIRVDTHCEAGYLIPPYYDSLLAKIIAWGPDRASAIRRMNRALEEVVVEGAGIDTNVDLHKAILAHPDFSQSAISTQWLSDYFGSPEWERRVRGEDLDGPVDDTQ
jgi:acetyl-CoA carboxylase biotin carboxylase subunit